MAVITVSNTGGNWSVTTTWVGGVVPSATLDTVAFTATSGQLTVNTTAVCIGIDFTNYVNTITFTALLTVNGPVNLGTGGYTQAGASGIQVGATATHTSGGVTWSRLWTFAGTGQTYTLGDNWNFIGILNFSASTSLTLNGNIINTYNLTISVTTPISGTTNINFNGTGTWQNTGIGQLKNNVTINTAGTLTIGANIYYNTGTLTYTAGTVTTTGSTLNIAASTTINTSGITWDTISITNNNNVTLTLTSNLNSINLTILNSSTLSFVLGGNAFNMSGVLTLNGATFNVPNNLQVTNLILGIGGTGGTINGLFTISVSGNLTENHFSSAINGTTSILLNGTGTWSSVSNGPIQNNLTIDTVGTITISGNVYYNTGTLTYISGTVITTGSTLNITLAATLNTNILNWNNVSFTTGTTTLTSDLNCQNLIINCNSTPQINLNKVYVSGNLQIDGTNLTQGTTEIVLIGNGTWSNTSNGQLKINLTINTNSTIKLGTNIYYNTKTLTYISGNVITKNNTLNIDLSTTLINCHKINFNNVIINSSSTLTMNEFFSGTPSLVTNINSNSVNNYTIAFKDGFEKISKFVNIRNCNLSNPLQLLVITNSKRSSTNRGIRYINQSPNGITKNNPSITNQTTYNSQMLISDPGMK